MSASEQSLRIGDVARLLGTTPRTIRYYEEIGLLPNAPERPSGGHRLYASEEVERMREVIRLKELLGVTLDELKDLLAAEEARATVRAQLRREDVHPERRRELLEEAQGHIDRQLELVEHRAAELAKLRVELCETRKRVRRKLREGAIQVPPSPEGVPGALINPEAIEVQEVEFPGADGTNVRGYLARPVTPGRYAGMIVIQDAAGVSEHIKDVTRRIANLGYVALAPDLYTREGGPPPPGNLEATMARLFAMSDAAVLADLEGAIDLLRSREDTTGKVGCIGFCMGGRCTLLLAGSSDKLDAAVDCWGGFIDSATPEERVTPQRPTPPLQLAEQVACPLMAAIGAEDQNPSPEIGERLRETLAKTPYETRVDVYEGAGHAFFADYRPSYRPEAAAKLWARVVPFLATHLKDELGERPSLQ